MSTWKPGAVSRFDRRRQHYGGKMVTCTMTSGRCTFTSYRCKRTSKNWGQSQSGTPAWRIETQHFGVDLGTGKNLKILLFLMRKNVEIRFKWGKIKS